MLKVTSDENGVVVKVSGSRADILKEFACLVSAVKNREVFSKELVIDLVETIYNNDFSEEDLADELMDILNAEIDRKFEKVKKEIPESALKTLLDAIGEMLNA